MTKWEHPKPVNPTHYKSYGPGGIWYPPGGTTGQILSKADGVDGTGQWISTDTIAGVVPVGGIIMWSGTIATIPTNWHLCDGAGGTIDLRDKFIVGATSDDGGVAKTNVTGGLTQTGGDISHHHANHTVTQPEIEDHSYATAAVTATGAVTAITSVTDHVLSVNVAVTAHDTLASLPVYYALAYIQRIT